MTHEVSIEVADIENGVTIHAQPTDEGVLIDIGDLTGTASIELSDEHVVTFAKILLQIVEDRELVVEVELEDETPDEPCFCEACLTNQGVIGYAQEGF